MLKPGKLEPARGKQKEEQDHATGNSAVATCGCFGRSNAFNSAERIEVAAQVITEELVAFGESPGLRCKGPSGFEAGNPT